MRNRGVGRAKAVQTGGQPGITRKIGTPVKIIERENGSDVYVLDTPGVFVPYVSEPERMFKLALCGCVKDGIISPVTLVDYLLYKMNLHDMTVYKRWSEPTDEVTEFLDRYARQAGRLSKGGLADIESAAHQLIHKYRAGDFGRFLLDDLEEEERRFKEGKEGGVDNDRDTVSMTHALKVEREAKKRARQAKNGRL